MINDEYKFIFIHIGKTGGTSIERVFDSSIGNYAASDFKGKHKTALLYQHHNPHEFKKYFKFTFVRNPWDREVSSYEYFRKLDLESRSFEDRLKYRMKKRVSFPLVGLKKIKVCGYNYMITDKSGKYFPDFIGRFENLQNDFNFICDKIGKSREILPHYNKINKPHYSEYYNERTKQMVAEAYEKEIENFGYRFE